MDTWILRKIRGAALRRLVAWGLTLGVGVLVVAANTRYIDNFVNGPFTLAGADLDAIDDVDLAPRYFVRVTGSRAIDTGLRQYTLRKTGDVETSRSETGAFYALAVGDRFLLVKTDSDPGTTAEGELAEMPSSVADNLFSDPDARAVRNRFYSFYLNNAPFRFAGYVVIALSVVFVALLTWKGIPAWKHFRDPASHPLAKRVASWGDALGVAVEVERESETPHHRAGGWALGAKYLVRSAVFTFDVLRVHDLLWAYKKVTKHSVNFIPTGKTYEAILVCYGGSAILRAKEQRVDEMLAFVAQRAPWAVLGFTQELADLFKKRQQEFIGAVEQRRREWAQGGREGQSGKA